MTHTGSTMTHRALRPAEDEDMTPQQIVIIRHAEKPDQKGDKSLSTKGFTRAAALAIYLPATFGPPNEIIATKESADSNRPVLTVTPLGQALGIGVKAKYSDHEYADLAKALLSHPKYDGESIVVCWHHEKIPKLAAALGVAQPPPWGDSVFDWTWVVTFPGGQASLATHQQELLFGDTPA